MTVCGRGGGRSSCRLAGFLANARIVLWEKKGLGGSRVRDVYAIINLSASISTPETFLNTKAKCPLDVSEAASLPLGWDLEEKFLNIFFFFPKEK